MKPAIKDMVVIALVEGWTRPATIAGFILRKWDVRVDLAEIEAAMKQLNKDDGGSR